MSKKFPSILIVNKHRRQLTAKASVESSENEQEIMQECSKKFSKKCRQDNKNSVTKPEVKVNGSNVKLNHLSNNIKKLVLGESSAKTVSVEQLQRKTSDNGNNDQKIKEQISKQKKRENHNIMLKRKKKIKEDKPQQQKSKDNGIINVNKAKKKESFPKHIPLPTLEEHLKNQESSEMQYVEGHLHINARLYKHAYIPVSDDNLDILIIGLRDRNRALQGDLVIASINPPEKWYDLPEGNVQKTGVIVCIKERVHTRKVVGFLKRHGRDIFCYPRDKRVPVIKVVVPKCSIIKSNEYQSTLFLASITEWEEPKFALGEIIKKIGKAGDILAESSAILQEHDLDVTPYSQEAIEGLPSSAYILTENDTKDREDWRLECVFSIDPISAVDIDDAVSCKLLENGNYEIGVHIADVTHYLEFLSPLDIQVAKRATTIYMTDNVYHMLPKQLCQLCSLLPGKDRLTFSVIWEITPDAKIIKHRFAKTIINSCCQMAYTHAQEFIENPEKEWPKDFLNICGNYTIDDLSIKVNILHELASQMRSKRFLNGALRIDQPKLKVTMDKTTGLPISYWTEKQNESNRLIEEFMLLTNMAVASHLYCTIPDTSFLRNHRGPSYQILNKTKDLLQKFGVHLNIDTSGALQASINRYEKELECEPNETRTILKYRMIIINNLCSKAMARATYRCSSTVNTKEELKHYSLNVPLYTHFTSPIRRYADCVVHRLLYSTMKNTGLAKHWTQTLCIKIAKNCNLKQYSAKQAQEQSSELYFTHLLELNGPLIAMGIVAAVQNNSIDVILCEIGIKLRVYLENLKELATIEYSIKCSVPTVSISWKQPVITQVVNVFTLLYLRVEKHPELFRVTGVPLPPNPSI